MRSPQVAHTQYERAQRVTEHHWQLQPYNFPKACFTGDLRMRYAGLAPEERAAMVKTWAGTTTADRADWRQIIDQGMQSGWYQILFGAIETLDPLSNGQICVKIAIRSEVTEASI